MSKETNKIYDQFFTTCFAKTAPPRAELQAKFYDRCFGWCLPNPQIGPALDIGAGLGQLMWYLRSKGYNDVTGIDISEEQCKRAEEFSGERVLHVTDTIGFLRSNRAKYGLITMSDVLEHIPKHIMVSFLEAVRESLHPDGIIIIKTENVSSPTGIYQHFMDFTHEYNFVESSLRQLLEIAGFSNIAMRGEPYPIARRPWLWHKILIRKLWWWVIRQVYEAEQPRRTNPMIFSKSLIAKACKK